MRINIAERVGQWLGRPGVKLFTIWAALNFLSVAGFGQGVSARRTMGVSGVSPRYWNSVANQEALDQAPPVDPKRFINGQWTLCTLSGWVRFYGQFDRKIGASMLMRNGGFMVGGQNVFLGDYLLDHFPHAAGTGDFFSYAQDKSWWAKDAGTVEIHGQVLHRLDYGALNAIQAAPIILSQDQIAAAKVAAAKKKADNDAKALAFNLKAAQAGDAYGEYRMGQRYRDGEGVAKDLRQSREWFAKAAAQGDKSSLAELASLPVN